MFGFHEKVRSRYIYFKDFMVRKRDVAISIAVVLLVIFGGIYLYVSNYQSPEERDITAMMEGKTKGIGGQVRGVNYKENKFVLRSMRPSGEYKEYAVNVGRKTEFIFVTTEAVEVFTDESEMETTPEIELRTTEEPASFGDVKEGAVVNVFFKERVDLDSEWRLTAETVKIFKQTNNIQNEDENDESR